VDTAKKANGQSRLNPPSESDCQHLSTVAFPKSVLRGLAHHRVRYTLILNDDSKRLGKLRAGYLRYVWQRFNDHPSGGFRYLRVSFLCSYIKLGRIRSGQEGAA
jgi:hypothetical protein